MHDNLMVKGKLIWRSVHGHTIIDLFMCWHPACLEPAHLWLSGGLSSGGINGDSLRAPLKPLSMIVLCDVRGFQGVPQLGPHKAEKRQALGQLQVCAVLFCSAGIQLMNISSFTSFYRKLARPQCKNCNEQTFDSLVRLATLSA